MNKSSYKELGFSLFELAIVIIISGVLLVAAIGAYEAYFEKKRIYTTQAKIETLKEALDRFFAEYNRYPCPARLDLGPDDAGFGVETNCLTAPPATGVDVQTGIVNLGITTATVDVRRGAIPFVTLKEGTDLYADEELYPPEVQAGLDLGSSDSIDTYSNKFTYVVTERQATPDYVPNLGAIIIRTEHVGPPIQYLSQNSQGNHADFLIISHGARSEGAWTYAGDQVGGGCVAALPDNQEENCDADVTYISSLRYDTGTFEYDDTLVYQNWVNYYLWDVENGEEENIYNLNTGKVGIGTTTPIERVHVVGGNAVADSAALTDASVKADQYCNFVSGAANGTGCFDPENIGGDEVAMACDTQIVDPGYTGPLTAGDVGNIAIKAIKNNTIECDTIYNTAAGDQVGTCPTPGEYLLGFKYNPLTKKLEEDCGTP